MKGKIKLSELIKKDKAGFGILSSYGWTCSKCVLEGFDHMRKQEGTLIPDDIEEAVEKWLPKLKKCECVPEKNLIIDEEGLRLLEEREREPGEPVIDEEPEDIEKPKWVEIW